MKGKFAMLYKRLLNIFKQPKLKKTLVVLTIFLIGFISGTVVTNTLKSNNKNTSPKSSNSRSSLEVQKKRSVQSLDESLKRSKERVAADVASKRITQAVADKLKAKIDEIYKVKKKALESNSDESKVELQKMRIEWRKWLDDNNLSSRYLTGLM